MIALDGQPVAIETPHVATRYGLSFIHQELALVPRMSVVENIMLGAPQADAASAWSTGSSVVGEVQPIAERVGIALSADGADLERCPPPSAGWCRSAGRWCARAG